jgi:hypothetical protein
MQVYTLCMYFNYSVLIFFYILHQNEASYSSYYAQ